MSLSGKVCEETGLARCGLEAHSLGERWLARLTQSLDLGILREASMAKAETPIIAAT
jgi:hypothetical protein